jgi:hypothetical protein
LAKIIQQKIFSWKDVESSGELERLKLPKCCIKYDADILKNLCKATRFDI